MTSTDTAGHPEVTEISDLTEGLLPPSRTADVRRHLDDCALCADVYASLEEIRGMLGTLPGPSRMPADVAERIDAALAAEALLNATEPDADTADTREPVGASRLMTGKSDGARVSRETIPSESLGRAAPNSHERAMLGLRARCLAHSRAHGARRTRARLICASSGGTKLFVAGEARKRSIFLERMCPPIRDLGRRCRPERVDARVEPGHDGAGGISPTGQLSCRAEL